MIICQVEVGTAELSVEHINKELDAIDGMLALARGGVFCAEQAGGPGSVNLFLCAECEQAVADVVEATDFLVKAITVLGEAHETYVKLQGWRTPQADERKKTRNYLLPQRSDRPQYQYHDDGLIVLQRNSQNKFKWSNQMPLTYLVDYFNQRISEAQGLAEDPLVLRNGRVESHFGGQRLNSDFHPIRRADRPDLIEGYDATISAETSQAAMEAFFQAADADGAVNLDRLCRTVHMLNYLPIAHHGGYLFLHVHPRHVLGVQRDHGAYFEQVIFRCGLSPRRVVITVPVKPLYQQHFNLLLEGVNNYKKRGYATAIKFDEACGEAFTEQYCIEMVYRATPDFVRFDQGFFKRLRRDASEGFRSTSLLSVVHGLDTELLLEGIHSGADSKYAQTLRAAYVKGTYYEQFYAAKELAKAG